MTTTEKIEETKAVETESTPKKTTRTRKTTTKTRATINKELRMKAKDIDVEVESLAVGVIFYESKKTGEILDLNEAGMREVVSLDLLIDMSKKSKSLLTKLVIGIVDVFSDDYKASDVVELLGLKDCYIFDEMNIENVDKFILDTDYTEFEKKFNAIKVEDSKYRFVERSIVLHKEGLLDSEAKKGLLERFSGNPYLYKNI